MERKGVLITFEGGEGSGKSSQARALYRHLLRSGVPTVLTHEPGGEPLARKLRRLLKGQDQVEPVAELLLFAASRAQLVSRVIRPALERGMVVISDRFADSTFAYQGYGRGLDLELIRRANQMATGGLQPDLTILLDLHAEAGLERKGRDRDRFRREPVDFHQRVRQGYLKLAGAEPGRWLVVDATLPRREIARRIWERVAHFIPRGSR